MLQLSVIDWGQRSWKTAIPYCLSVGRSCDYCGRYGSRTPTFGLCVHVQCSHKTAHTAAGSRKPPAKVQKIILDPFPPPPPPKKSSLLIQPIIIFLWMFYPVLMIDRYSHTAHVIDNQLILVGGVNVNHSVPGVAVIDIDSKKVREFSIPVSELLLIIP